MKPKTEKARLDADKSAKPKTRIVGHAQAGVLQGPGITTPDTYVSENGEHVPLATKRVESVGLADDDFAVCERCKLITLPYPYPRDMLCEKCRENLS